MFKHVLMTLDGSSLSEAVMPKAVKLLRGSGAEVHLMTVAKEPQATPARSEGEPLTVGIPSPGGVVQLEAPPPAETKAQAIARVSEELHHFLIEKAAPLEHEGIHYQRVVRFGEPAEEIIRYAEKHGVDLIIMATHGHSGLGRLVFGSVAERVLASGVCPVLLVRPDGSKLRDG